ncbi:Sec-independent protein translocase subunit TatA [Methylosarcina fibrata]|uniref:Sec-independent protein translocase subunit TatA n=1 Tax=Methylosarcina fibrata TaxID=105972 RepID=UPI000364736B|nr:Sec-independent protein translocase subunit TatA [Methylosarcina fibrata]
MGISVTKLLIVLAIILVLFGTKRLRNVGSDLGDAIKNFRLALKEGENESSDQKEDDSATEEQPSEQIRKK